MVRVDGGYKKEQHHRMVVLFFLVGANGLEPSTSCV